MRCLVTAGPTYETMDNVRRLTNFSTGKLGTELANFLTTRGHEVALLIGEQATHCGERFHVRLNLAADRRDWLWMRQRTSADSTGTMPPAP